MEILTELNMHNNKIINLKDAVNKNDVINKGQLDEFKMNSIDTDFLLKIIHS